VFRRNSKLKLLAILARIRSSITCWTQMVHHLLDCHVFLCNVIDKSMLELVCIVGSRARLLVIYSFSIFSIILSIIQLGFTLQHQIMFLLNTHNFHFTFLGFMQVLFHIFYFNLLFVLCCHYLLLLLLLMSSMVDNFKHPSIL